MTKSVNDVSPFSPNYFGAERKDIPKSPVQEFRKDGSYDTTGYSKGITPKEDAQAKASLLQQSQKLSSSGKKSFPKNSIFYQPPGKSTSSHAATEQLQTKLDDSYATTGDKQEESRLHERRGTASYPDVKKPKDGKILGFFRYLGRKSRIKS